MRSSPFRLGLSPCPNDTFIFGPWVLGWLSDAPRVEPLFDDVQKLNELASCEQLDISKISFGAWPFLKERWELLESGGALGRGCGPLLLTSPRYSGSDNRCWLPGEQTTAAMLFRWWSQLQGVNLPVAYDRFDRIYNRLVSGEIGVGVAIHEGRFTFAKDGLECSVDLGEKWEEETGMAIPLGGIVLHRNLMKRDSELKAELELTIRRSIAMAHQRFEELMPWIIQKAGIQDRSVVESHIATYVNAFSERYGREGWQAIDFFEKISLTDR